MLCRLDIRECIQTGEDIMRQRKHHINQGILIAAILGFVSTAYALEPVPTAPITFDPQGTSGANGLEVGSFDWSPNSTLSKGSIPLVDGSSFQTYTHTALQGSGNADGNPQGIPGLNADYEITLVGGVKVDVSVTGASVQTNGPAASGENFVRIYHDDNVNSDALTGANYSDGDVILEGTISLVNSLSTISLDPLESLDSFGADNWGGTTTVTADGGQQAFILVSFVDPAYFPDLEVGSLLPYSTEAVLSFKQTNPSQNLDTEGGTTASNVGNINGQNGPDFLEQVDPNNSFVPLVEGEACRVTGGGNDTAGITANGVGWDSTEVSGSQTFTETVVKVKGRSGKVTVEDIEYTNVYTFGGQAGANTALQPQPKGELEHVNHEGPAGQWSFHMGTASAPPGTEIDIIQCSDPGWCRQARPAPSKQIDFAGIGTFRNIIEIGNLNDGGDCAAKTQLKGKPSERGIGTYNWAEVHIEDHGEPGREGQHTTADPGQCPVGSTGTDAFSAYNGTGSRVDAVLAGTYNSFECKTDNDPSTECPDFYRIRIYCGVEPTFDNNDELSNFDAIAAEKANGPIYEVFGYIDGGNWQIHPLTGFDLHRR
jgi:hypothetical protein